MAIGAGADLMGSSQRLGVMARTMGCCKRSSNAHSVRVFLLSNQPYKSECLVCCSHDSDDVVSRTATGNARAGISAPSLTEQWRVLGGSARQSAAVAFPVARLSVRPKPASCTPGRAPSNAPQAGPQQERLGCKRLQVASAARRGSIRGGGGGAAGPVAEVACQRLGALNVPSARQQGLMVRPAEACLREIEWGCTGPLRCNLFPCRQ